MIEVVAALAIMGILIMPLATLLMQGILQQQRAGLRTQVMAAAIKEMESLKAAGDSLRGRLDQERAPTEEYPYVAGQNNYCQGPVGDLGVTHEIHFIRKELLLNQEPLLKELLLIEIFDGEGNQLLASFYVRREI